MNPDKSRFVEMKKQMYLFRFFSFEMYLLVVLIQQRTHFWLTKVRSFFIQAAGLVSHHGNAVYLLLRLDDIQHFVLMIYRNKLRMIYTPSA